ncbi:hypothetical protein JR316_0000857 [Psilocybe cubensis]|uniref:Uncharacterized protein n=2 Tax=Psilocybe cubensis TaxID=181762 RepID=A0ACB8HGK1_PSICU|nr:hypothetical protein JR316_0000857 [Psilocybe cubensis]KAH9486792.1 hypothetical protein JR316_0000857 [Psilocybe cubensis]
MSTFRPKTRMSLSPNVYAPGHSMDTTRPTITKRCHTQQLQRESLSCSDSDDDIVRQGKRRRRDNSVSLIFKHLRLDIHYALQLIEETVDNYLEPFSWPRQSDDALQMDRVSQFPTTSSAFSFFPSSSPPLDRCFRSSSPDSGGFQEGAGEGPSDLARLRTSAFWELRQSVTENGEGLVRRMRDYERSRSRHQTHQKAKDAEKRGRKRATRRQKTYSINASEEEDDDILISSGDSSTHIKWCAFVNKRSRSLDDMDVDSQKDVRSSIHQIRSQSSGPPSDVHHPTGSQYHQQNKEVAALLEDLMSPYNSCTNPSLEPTPGLSHSSCESANSSLLSLALPPSILEADAALPSTASEKALAALSLALENGAGSITDYSSIWKYQEQFSLGETHDYGELWN